MNVLQRVTGWLSGKGYRGAQGAYGGYKQRGYYGSPEAEDAYGSLAADRSYDMPEEPFNPETNPSADRFGGSADPYNGRVPYRSQRDFYAEQEEAQRMQPDLRHRRTEAQQQQSYQQQAPYQQQPAYQQPQESNVVNFPGQPAAAPTHVEYVILLRSRNECTKVIEYIKTNASVFMNMEYIANESERQRCVDMLSGAAYTLGCQLHKISNRGIYLIASPNVRVMIDPAMKRFSGAPEPQPFLQQQTGEYPPVTLHSDRQPMQPAASFADRQAEDETPYPQQQAAYSPFQRPRPTFQSQSEPFRRASGQYGSRQPAPYQASF